MKSARLLLAAITDNLKMLSVLAKEPGMEAEGLRCAMREIATWALRYVCLTDDRTYFQGILDQK